MRRNQGLSEWKGRIELSRCVNTAKVKLITYIYQNEVTFVELALFALD